MDYLDDNFNSKRKRLAGSNAVQGELVTPTPDKYTKPKALPNETFIDGQKASTSVGRPNPQIAQTQQALPKPNTLNGELFTQSPANFKPTPAVQNPIIDGQVSRPVATVNNPIKPAPLGSTSSSALSGDLLAQNPATFKPAATAQGSIIEGQVSRPMMGAQQTMNAVSSGTTQSLTQMAQPPTGNAGGGVGAAPPAQSITSRLASGASKLASSMPAIQAGMNASNIMNQEANFAKNIHAGSIADPNFGNELMGDAPQKSFSRTQTPLAKPTSNAPIQGGRGFAVTEPPEQFINSRAGKITNPAYTQYMASHPQKPVVAPVNQATPQAVVNNEQINTNRTPPNYSLADPRKPQTTHAEILLNGQSPTQSKMPTSMNDVTSGTGFIKASKNTDGSIAANHNPLFDKGMGFVQNENGMMGSDGKQRTPQRGLSMPTISDNRMDVNVLDRLEAQRASGAITAAQAGQIYAQHQEQAQFDAIQKLPPEQRAQAVVQLAAGKGDISAAQTEQRRQDLLAQQKTQQDIQNEQTQYARNNPIQLLAEHKAKLEMMAASKDPTESEQGRQGLAQLAALAPTPLEKLKTKTFDPTTSLPLAEQEVFGNPITGQIYNRGEQRTTGDAPAPEGSIGIDKTTGKKVKIVRGMPVPVD